MTMAGNIKSKAFDSILKKSASEKEKEIQTIGSVVNTEEVMSKDQSIEEKVVQTTETISVEETTGVEVMETIDKNLKIQSNSSKTRKLSDYLEDRKIKETEPIRISKEMHGKFKKLSVASGCSIHVILTNILEEFCEFHDKEIQAVIKKYLLS